MEKMPVDYAFDDLCEVVEDYETLSDEDLLICRGAIKERLDFVLEILGEYVQYDYSEGE